MPVNPPAVKTVFFPQTMGIFMLLIIILAFIAGTLGRELSLTLTGAVFLALWAYCLVMTLVLAFIHRRRAVSVSTNLNPRDIIAGEKTELAVSGGRTFFRLPGILVRCRLLLKTRDGRCVRHDFDPGLPGGQLALIKRGAYFSEYDEFAIFDALGFFRFAFRVPQDAGPRILASPNAAEESLSARFRSGGTEQRSEFTFQRTDNLIEHRPYVPGDDPRRINWKLYGHGGELFVREGEREPPPHSNIIIIIDTQADSLLYSAEQARQAVDLICENALAAALACVDSGMDVRVGYSGASSVSGFGGKNSSAEPAAVFAWPAALSFSEKGAQNKKAQDTAPLPGAEYPSAPDDCGILILALPRVNAETSALDRFLKKQERPGNQPVEIFFVYADKRGSKNLFSAAETCVSLYNGKEKIRARGLLCSD
jgi:uncharacterized protein (DUF58 family)